MNIIFRLSAITLLSIIFLGLQSCADNEINNKVNTLKTLNEDLLAQIGALKNSTDSAITAVGKLSNSQNVTDTKIVEVKLQLQSLLAQIATLNTQMASETANTAAIQVKIEALQKQCVDLVAQIAYLTQLSKNFTIKLDASPLNSGALSISPKSDVYKYGTEVTITAAPGTGFSFVKWTGDTSTISYPLKFKVTKDFKVSALFEPTNGVKDIDGNVYGVVKIGNQTWMKENLNVTKYQNGDAIPNVKDNTEWANLSSGAYSRYNNADVKNDLKNGVLYNGFVVQDSRNVCPVGFRIPNVEDFTILTNYLGGYRVAGGKLKEAGNNSQWTLPNEGATNESGFTALPSGNRRGKEGNWTDGMFWDLGNITWFYTSNISPAGGFYVFAPYYVHSEFTKGASGDLKAGYSIRCIKN